MEKKIENYLPLYFKCWGTICNSNCEFENGNWALSAKIFHEVMMGNCKFIPHLVPLSDITEAQKVELILSHPQWQKFDRIEYKETTSEGISFSGKIGSFSFDCLQSMNNFYPDQFVYLLQETVDLFGLIDAGLALVKQNKPNA